MSLIHLSSSRLQPWHGSAPYSRTNSMA
jgi:hypothetical protein